MLDKKQIQMIFLLELKMSHKAAETTHNINNALAQELLTNTQCSGGSTSFTERIEADPLTTAWEVAEELNINHFIVIWHLKQIEEVK